MREKRSRASPGARRRRRKRGPAGVSAGVAGRARAGLGRAAAGGPGGRLRQALLAWWLACVDRPPLWAPDDL